MFGILGWFSPTRWIALAVIVAALVAGYFGWQHHQRGIGEARGMAKVQAKWDAEKAKQVLALEAVNKAAHAKELSLQRQKDEAVNAAAKKTQLAQAAAAATRRTADSLRDELATTRAELSGAPLAAVRKRADALSEFLGQCASEYSEVAGRADRIAIDRDTLIQAWPK